MNAAPGIAIVAGEPSGDRLGAGLIKAIRARRPETAFYGMAGTEMAAAGCEPLAHIDQLSVMGLSEVARSYFRLRRLRDSLAARIVVRQPRVVVGIDVPDFNFGLEKIAKAAGIPTVHYVCPQAWAWRSGRAKRMPRIADRWLAVLPFEPAFFANFGVDVEFVGHPLADDISLEADRAAARRQLGLGEQASVLALMPGSRRQEIDRLMPAFAQAARNLVQDDGMFQHLVVGVARPEHEASLRAELRGFPATFSVGHSATVLTAADLAVVASGTVTLEALFCKTPTIVAYRLAGVSYHIMKRMIRVPNIALSNIIAGQELAPELVQDQVSAENIIKLANNWYEDEAAQGRYRDAAFDIHSSMRRDASERAADAVLRLADERG